MTTLLKGVIRQGDVLLLPIHYSKLSGQKLPHLTLAEGEVTGHSHRISTGKAELYEREGVLYLRVLSEQATLQHEEHQHLNIPRGEWMIHIQREYQPVKNSIKKSKLLVSPENKPKAPKKSPNLTEEVNELVGQIDGDYWEKMVKDAEKRKEYLDKLQAKSKQKEIENQEKKPNRKKIKYMDNDALNFFDSPSNFRVPNPNLQPQKTSPKSEISIDGFIIQEQVKPLEKEAQNWRNVID